MDILNHQDFLALLNTRHHRIAAVRPDVVHMSHGTVTVTVDVQSDNGHSPGGAVGSHLLTLCFDHYTEAEQFARELFNIANDARSRDTSSDRAFIDPVVFTDHDESQTMAEAYADVEPLADRDSLINELRRDLDEYTEWVRTLSNRTQRLESITGATGNPFNPSLANRVANLEDVIGRLQ